MKILVTGHLGYIGTVLTPMLLERGHDVVGLDSDLFAACTFAGKIEDVPSIGRDVRDFVTSADAVEALRGLDEVAYVRFASVYREFRDINEFMRELKTLLNRRSK